MQTTLPPSIDRLGAALRALRQAYAPRPDSEDKTSLGTKCLHVLIAQLAEEGVPQEDLQPLVDLQTGIEALRARAQGEGTANRRRRKPPSDPYLARMSAVIDLLVKGGYDEAEAAQVVMRKMLAAGVPPPQRGGDARGWKRLLAWRADLSHGIGSPEAKHEYREFSRDIDDIPVNDRVNRVLGEQLWDRRRKPG